MYNKFLLFHWRLAGQITPAEWAIMGQESSTPLFLLHNAAILAFFGGCAIYQHFVTKLFGSQQSEPAALLIMNYLRGFSNTFTFFSVMINHVVYHKSYSALRLHLETHVGVDKDKKFQTVVNLIMITVLVVYAFTVQYDMQGQGELIERLILSCSILPHALSLLYSCKLICLVRHVTLHFFKANLILSQNLTRMGGKFCPVGPDELDQLLIQIVSCHDFLHKINAIAGTDFALIMFDMYVAIIYRLYVVSRSLSPLEPNTTIIIYQFVLTGMNFLWCTTIMANGSLLTSEVARTTKIIWNAAPYIKCGACGKKLFAFARQINCLPPDLSARGIFKLNMKTFSNIIASTVTQLVILISLGQ